MKYLILTLSLALVNCAPKGSIANDSAVESPAPAPAPIKIPVTKVVKCGDTIISTMGMAFKVNPTTGDTVQLPDGTYTYPRTCNGWGCTQECSYTIVKGEVSP